ncbi:hypothetical protein QEZ54_16825 [Catellatospora sp. KI3]|uniref:hypothetical protein n=1 Tax=Catellatospora sp. KI3 TaxID=3041620 RepID=UPI0024824FFB|nr:hypothetical protein [Catellatospora sp. KI3]MDI1462639.1 hypothetical protein [Catellatospora sp. KI3]
MADAIHAIVRRRDDVDDPHREALTQDPLEVLSYLRKYSAGMPQWVREADVVDGLKLRVWLWWLCEEHEDWLLARSEQFGVSRAAVGEVFGIGSSQGVASRIKRKRELIRGGTAQQEQRVPLEPAQQLLAAMMPGADPRQPWLDRRRGEVDALSQIISEGQRLLPDDEEELHLDLIAVGENVRDGVYTPGAFVQLAVAAGELAAVAAVQALPPDDALRQALRRVDVLYEGWRRLP